ncbi:unnamed protein product [Effrenium voratum]|uniref:Calcineurin-like phosphoesterase domain-containing protein n=1 Tax=Effrenium voratum TaxID=2562239 RepID=A0AA36MI44_9DINO|nr:unnamed protein product [Effrenium voratum]
MGNKASREAAAATAEAFQGIFCTPLSCHDLVSDSASTVRCVAMSDTHCQLTAEQAREVPAGDVFLHAGDICMKGTKEELMEFNNWLGLLPHRYKVVIAGNHDLCLAGEERRKLLSDVGDVPTSADIRTHLLPNATHYLENEIAELVFGNRGQEKRMRIFGSPVTVPVSATREMLVARKYGAFAMPEEEQKQLWASALPSSGPQVDVVLTHGPPQGILDQMFHGKHVGSHALAQHLGRLLHAGTAPKVVVFGHVHERHGLARAQPNGGASTTFINAASVNMRYKLRPESCCVVFDVECGR